MRRVAASWRGMDTRMVFDGWRQWARVEIEKRHQVAKRARKRKELEHAGMLALEEMAKYEVSLFERQYDEWNERTYWKNRETSEVTQEEPNLGMFLPDDFVLPVPPLTPRDQDQMLARWNEKKQNIDEAPEEVRTSLTTHSEARERRLKTPEFAKRHGTPSEVQQMQAALGLHPREEFKAVA